MFDDPSSPVFKTCAFYVFQFDKFSKLDSPFHRPGVSISSVHILVTLDHVKILLVGGAGPFHVNDDFRIFQLGLSPYPGISPLIAPGNPASSATPFSTPNQMAAFQPKVSSAFRSRSIYFQHLRNQLAYLGGRKYGWRQ